MFTKIFALLSLFFSLHTYGCAANEHKINESSKDPNKSTQNKDIIVLPWNTAIERKDYSKKKLSFSKGQIEDEQDISTSYKQIKLTPNINSAQSFEYDFEQKYILTSQSLNYTPMSDSNKDISLSLNIINIGRQKYLGNEMNKFNILEDRINRHNKKKPLLPTNIMIPMYNSQH